MKQQETTTKAQTMQSCKKAGKLLCYMCVYIVRLKAREYQVCVRPSVLSIIQHSSVSYVTHTEDEGLTAAQKTTT